MLQQSNTIQDSYNKDYRSRSLPGTNPIFSRSPPRNQQNVLSSNNIQENQNILKPTPKPSPMKANLSPKFQNMNNNNSQILLQTQNLTPFQQSQRQSQNFNQNIEQQEQYHNELPMQQTGKFEGSSDASIPNYFASSSQQQQQNNNGQNTTQPLMRQSNLLKSQRSASRERDGISNDGEAQIMQINDSDMMHQMQSSTGKSKYFTGQTPDRVERGHTPQIYQYRQDDQLMLHQKDNFESFNNNGNGITNTNNIKNNDYDQNQNINSNKAQQQQSRPPVMVNQEHNQLQQHQQLLNQQRVEAQTYDTDVLDNASASNRPINSDLYNNQNSNFSQQTQHTFSYVSPKQRHQIQQQPRYDPAPRKAIQIQRSQQGISNLNNNIQELEYKYQKEKDSYQQLLEENQALQREIMLSNQKAKEMQQIDEYNNNDIINNEKMHLSQQISSLQMEKQLLLNENRLLDSARKRLQLQHQHESMNRSRRRSPSPSLSPKQINEERILYKYSSPAHRLSKSLTLQLKDNDRYTSNLIQQNQNQNIPHKLSRYLNLNAAFESRPPAELVHLQQQAHQASQVLLTWEQNDKLQTMENQIQNLSQALHMKSQEGQLQKQHIKELEYQKQQDQGHLQDQLRQSELANEDLKQIISQRNQQMHESQQAQTRMKIDFAQQNQQYEQMQRQAMFDLKSAHATVEQLQQEIVLQRNQQNQQYEKMQKQAMFELKQAHASIESLQNDIQCIQDENIQRVQQITQRLLLASTENDRLHGLLDQTIDKYEQVQQQHAQNSEMLHQQIATLEKGHQDLLQMNGNLSQQSQYYQTQLQNFTDNAQQQFDEKAQLLTELSQWKAKYSDMMNQVALDRQTSKDQSWHTQSLSLENRKLTALCGEQLNQIDQLKSMTIQYQTAAPYVQQLKQELAATKRENERLNQAIVERCRDTYAKFQY